MKKFITRRVLIKQTATACAVAALPVSILLTKKTALAKSAIEHKVNIGGFTFDIETLLVKVGDTVKWVNNDIVPHTATAKDRSWDTGLISPGNQASITIIAGMSAEYFCEYHPMMVAEIIVKS
jgi:plastocyanin